jgi:hypothetical protein
MILVNPTSKSSFQTQSAQLFQRALPRRWLFLQNIIFSTKKITSHISTQSAQLFYKCFRSMKFSVARFYGNLNIHKRSFLTDMISGIKPKSKPPFFVFVGDIISWKSPKSSCDDNFVRVQRGRKFVAQISNFFPNIRAFTTVGWRSHPRWHTKTMVRRHNVTVTAHSSNALVISIWWRMTESSYMCFCDISEKVAKNTKEHNKFLHGY